MCQLSYVVTGAAGFIGSHLCEALLREGHQVVGVDCFTDYYSKRLKLANIRELRKKKSFKLVQTDLSSGPIGAILRDAEYVFHLAAQPGVRASWGQSFSYYVKDNIVATQRLLEAVKDRPVKRLIYASSSSIYGDSERLPTPEESVPRPVSPYGATKLAAEHLCHVYYRNYQVPVVILRYFTVYGPRQRPDMAFNIFISKIAAGKQIDVYGDGEQKRDFTFVADTVAGTILAARADPGATFNIGAGASTSLNEVISTMESIIGKKAKVNRIDKALGDVRNTSADISKITRLGYRARTPLLDGLKQQVTSQIDQGIGDS